MIRYLVLLGLQRDNERYFALLKVSEINFEDPENVRTKALFENLTPYFPEERLKLEQGTGSVEDLTARIIDLASPIGKGQRGLIVFHPKQVKQFCFKILHHQLQKLPRCSLNCTFD